MVETPNNIEQGKRYDVKDGWFIVEKVYPTKCDCLVYVNETKLTKRVNICKNTVEELILFGVK